jgi:hypothetical protein
MIFNRNILALLIFVTLIFCTFVTGSYAATINATSCSAAHVQSAINSATDGDTVVIPAGECTWDTTVTANGFSSITIQGAGIDQTIIHDNYAEKSVLNVINIGTGPVRITGFTIDGDGSISGGIGDGCIFLTFNGDSNATRVDHIKFIDMKARGVIWKLGTNRAWGVIDNCIFETQYQNQGVAVTGEGGNSTWWWDNEPLNLGSKNFVFIEDSVFNWIEHKSDAALDAYGGAKYVFRYNTVINTCVSHHGTDSGNYVAPHSFELYENQFLVDHVNGGGRTLHSRGGTGVVFNNTWNKKGTVRQVYNNFLSLSNYRSCASYGNWGMCDGSESWDDNTAAINGSGIHTGADNSASLTDNTKGWLSNQWSSPYSYYIYNITDGSKCAVTSNTSIVVSCSLSGGTDNDWDNGDQYKITNGYPCLGQNGTTYDHDGDGINDIEPLYEWGNTRDSDDVRWSYGGICDRISDHLKGEIIAKNDTQRPGYTPYDYPHPLTQESAPAAPELMLKDAFLGGSVWTKSTGKTYTYYLTSKKYGGRHIKKVTEDDTELVEIASIDLCESTTGSYFLDSSDGNLYVHCTDGADPDTHEIEVYYN